MVSAPLNLYGIVERDGHSKGRLVPTTLGAEAIATKNMVLYERKDKSDLAGGSNGLQTNSDKTRDKLHCDRVYNRWV